MKSFFKIFAAIFFPLALFIAIAFYGAHLAFFQPVEQRPDAKMRGGGDFVILAEAWQVQMAVPYLFLFGLSAIIALYLTGKTALPARQLSMIAQNIESGEIEFDPAALHDPAMIGISDPIRRIYSAIALKNRLLQEEQEKQNYLYSILEEGVLLLDERNCLLIFNKKAEQYLGVALKVGINILRDIEDFEILTFFQEILKTKTDNLWKERELGSKLYEVNLRIKAGHYAENSLGGGERPLAGYPHGGKAGKLHQEKLVVLYDITKKSRYKHYKSRLTGNISHELRTPLSMIMGYSETILSDRSMPSDTLRRFLKKIYKNSRRLNDIVTDMLELHKLEAGKEKTARTVSTDVAKVFDELKSGFFEQHIGKELLFTTHVESVAINYEHLFSMLSNLVANAIEYSSGKRIYISVTRVDAQIEIQVEDEGPTIPLEERERIFERFYTISRSRNRFHSGTGLGLPIVKHIAQLYGGIVSLHEGSRGNCFTISLP